MAIEFMDLFGYLGIIMVNAAYLPQIVKTLRLRRTSQISPLFYLSIASGIVCYEIYALWRNDPVFIISNILGLIQPCLMIYLSMKWRKSE
jgi:MtN3 and saliva related transmembrane protein